MFKIESYVTPILLSYVDKYVRDFKPGDAQVSLWGGGVALHNLVLKADVLQQEVALPFTLVSGRIHELLIQVPWTKIMSEPIVVTIDTIECILNQHQPQETAPPEPPSRSTQVVETPPGYMQALVRRIVSNIALRVHHLIVKYVHDDIVLSLNVKHLAVDSAGANWEPAFADIDQNQPLIRRLVRLDDFTLCLDKADADGKIRFYQEPLLYRCRLDLRVLTYLVSANTRRASRVAVQLCSARLAWSVTSEQLALLLRLLLERARADLKAPPAPKQPAAPPPAQTSTKNSAEPTRTGSWSDWAWSWLPSLSDKEPGVEDVPTTPSPLPVYFDAYLDDVSLVFKVIEQEGAARKRFRSVLEMGASFAAIKSAACSPTSMRMQFGARDITLRSYGKCVCGFINNEASEGKPMIYLKRLPETEGSEEAWQWPAESLMFGPTRPAARASPPAAPAPPAATPTAEDKLPTGSDAGIPEGVVEAEQVPAAPVPSPQLTAHFKMMRDECAELLEDTAALWGKMAPVVLVDFTHVRSPPNTDTNPYDNPPKDFQYSDWVEACNVKVKIQPLQFSLSVGLIHRFETLRDIFNDIASVPTPEQSMRVLTIEECDALNDNMPERRFSVEARGLQLQLLPGEHTPADRPPRMPLVLLLELPSTSVSVSGPLYPHRICSAACQMPQYLGPLWQASRLNISVAIHQAQLRLAAANKDKHRPCARADVRLVVHVLLHRAYFNKRECEFFGYSAKINEMNICGSAARLQAAWEVVRSLLREQLSVALRHSTLPHDALNDEEAVAVDFTLEGLVFRAYRTQHLNTYIITIQSAKGTAFHEPSPGNVKQAWIFSAPDLATTSPYLRAGLQWSDSVTADSFEYVGVWAEPTAAALDPLLVAWLAYKPTLFTNYYDPTSSSGSTISGKNAPYMLRKKTQSSSGRGGSRSAGSAELVHMPTRASTVSSEPSDRRPSKAPQPVVERWWQGERLVALHQRLRCMLIHVEIGSVHVYVTMSTASALDCATLRDAMERHACTMHRVVAFSLGRLLITSDTAMRYLWDDVQRDAPTLMQKSALESFPWKLKLSDVSCFTLEAGVERVGSGGELTPKDGETRPVMKEVPEFAYPKTVLQLLTTTLTVSVVTKALQIKNVNLPRPKKPASTSPANAYADKTKYFTVGKEFKPSTLQEFLRGPSRTSKREAKDTLQKQTEEQKPDQHGITDDVTVTKGPIVSLGVHLHADTPPVVVRLERDQMHVVTAAIHCLNHLVTLLRRDPITIPKARSPSIVEQKIPSMSEIEVAHTISEDTRSKSSELIEIFDRTSSSVPKKLSTFFWFQWVVSRATLVVASSAAKLAFDVDDILATVDVQAHYNQLKIKLAAASVRHYERENNEWVPGVLGGRVIEARETFGAKDEDHFLGVTITQARISDLPDSWKQELHPKLLEKQNGDDSMWEIYATLAPLEVIVLPDILDNVATLLAEVAPRASCPLKGHDPAQSHWQLPFIYLTAGGLRLLVTGRDEQVLDKEDTLVLHIGRVTVNPHPDNPICRRSVTAAVDGGWLAATSSHEGRQYELHVRRLAIRSACFNQLISQASHEEELRSMNENPALKWSKQIDPPTITALLHPVDICCVVAPALYLGGTLVCGPAFELNLITDCTVELSVHQVALCQRLFTDISSGLERESVTMLGNDKHGRCPYAELLMTTVSEVFADSSVLQDSGRSLAEDSGVETMASTSTSKARTSASDDLPYKKSVSILLSEQIADANEYLEIFVTMGVIQAVLSVADDDSPGIAPLRPPSTVPREEEQRPDITERHASAPLEQLPSKKDESITQSSKSLSDHVRDKDAAQFNVELEHFNDTVKKLDTMALVTVTLQQPNLYYWRKKGVKNIQASLFNMCVSLGSAAPGQWNAVLLSTAPGALDPATDIPPALATLNIIAPIPSSQYFSATIRGSVKLDVERPVLVEVSSDRIKRLRAILKLLKNNLYVDSDETSFSQHNQLPMLYRLRQKFFQENMESVVVTMGQVGLAGCEGSLGWDSLNVQLAAGGRPERVVLRALCAALVGAVGPAHDLRHVLLSPTTLGVQMEATWEAWRRAEGSQMAREPAVRLGIELDRVVVDVRPSELGVVTRLLAAFKDLAQEDEASSSNSSELDVTKAVSSSSLLSEAMSKQSVASIGSDTSSHQYYKDDLRSGAFKIVKSPQLPMAYQVLLHGSGVSWCYPHPRAITRIVAYPLPDVDIEINCVLELFTPILDKWEPHTYFTIPVSEPREIQLYVPPPDAVFATMWRFRTCDEKDSNLPDHQFNIQKFTPRADPLTIERTVDDGYSKTSVLASAEQLSGVVRVDSYFAPRLLPRLKLTVRLAQAELHAHNSLLKHASVDTVLEGYYVSRPLMRSHRVLSLIARNTKLHAQLGSPAGVLYALDSTISSDILDCSLGTMEQLSSPWRVQAGVSAATWDGQDGRARVSAAHLHVGMHLPRLRTLRALMLDWKHGIEECMKVETPSKQALNLQPEPDKLYSKHESASETAAALEGRVFLWVHNTCAAALRVGQEGTDELVPLGPGAVLAYRWRSPSAPKRLRFALATPSANWHWSPSIPFTVGKYRVKLEEPLFSDKKDGCGNMGTYVHVRVEESGAKRTMYLAGTLLLANMLRLNLLYKVRMRCAESGAWRTLCSDEMACEQLGRSVICHANSEMVLKIKLTSHDTGWSGDIPLKECPKENVPWLVKVPSEGEMSFVSVWCRVTRARHDGRILATLWPLYALHSHLPLDTDVLIVTEPVPSSKPDAAETAQLPPLVQATPGRGTTTHLLAPGTTANKHSLSFQYRNIECPVTREAVPMHYGVTDVSVFDKRLPVMHIDEVKQDIQHWLNRSSRTAKSDWPYSLVAKHWDGAWRPALLQPRCDVTVRYGAVHAGGGCCLEVVLSPVVLFCNASPLALTLRSYDASPLCKLEPGTAISPPSAIMTKPFYISVEVCRETFVSGALCVSAEEPGRYGAPPPGQLALDRDAKLAIVCNQKVALLTMYYEIKNDINVLGVSSTFVLINRLDRPVLASPVATPEEDRTDNYLLAKTFKVVQPTPADSIHGTSMSRFWLRGRWQGGSPDELHTYLLLALPADTYPAAAPVPVRLAAAPVRRAVALLDQDGASIPITVSQIKHESRWLVVVARDPCPQFVVHNHTRLTMVVGEPQPQSHQPSTSQVTPIRECSGAVWWCKVRPGEKLHYSSPSHCLRYPPPAPPALTQTVTLLTFGKRIEEESYEWCAPVAAADGEQLLQYHGGVTIKLRVRTHPHSTLLELKDTDQNDISPSDIRRRLHGAVNSEETTSQVCPDDPPLERIAATSTLLKNEVEPSSQMEATPLLVRSGSALEAGPHGVASEPLTDSTTNKDTEWHLRYTPTDRSEFMSQTWLAPQTTSSEYALGGEATSREVVRAVLAGLVLELAASPDVPPLLALHVDRTVLLALTQDKTTKMIISVADVQVDNMQYESGQYDFAVVASTRSEPLPPDPWPPLWNIFGNRDAFRSKHQDAKLLVKLFYDSWTIQSNSYTELSEIDVSIGSVALYVEDAYVRALLALASAAWPQEPASEHAAVLAEERALRRPLRLRKLHVRPLDLTLTLHTAVRMYIALDQSPLQLSAFKLHDMMTSAERLTHALTVHYLSAAILGAGWVVGGLELLGAPGALAARLGGASGGMKGVASATAAALLRSLSAWAGSLARNLDLLAGDEEHARRAAAARRRPPPSFVAGLVAGLTNFAINILGAVGGLAHHPLVGVAVGETESSAAALRRGLLGALTKPLSATADLVAYAGHGLLTQTGWDPIPKARRTWSSGWARAQAGWRRDCVRWSFRLADMHTLAGFEVLLDNAPLQLLLTHKCLVVADPETERIVEMIDFRCCSLRPYTGSTVEITVRTQRKSTKWSDLRHFDDEDEYQISAAAMARVARYTGSEEASAQPEYRLLSLSLAPAHSLALHAMLATLLHYNVDTHLSLL